MGIVRISLRRTGTYTKLDARGKISDAVNAAEKFRTVMREHMEGGSLWRPTVTPTPSGAEMLMGRPPSVDQDAFNAVIADAVEHYRTIAPSSPLFVS